MNSVHEMYNWYIMSVCYTLIYCDWFESEVELDGILFSDRSSWELGQTNWLTGVNRKSVSTILCFSNFYILFLILQKYDLSHFPSATVCITQQTEALILSLCRIPFGGLIFRLTNSKSHLLGETISKSTYFLQDRSRENFSSIVTCYGNAITFSLTPYLPFAMGIECSVTD